jgi:hypothetical protein
MNRIAPEGIAAFAARMRNTKADFDDSLGLIKHCRCLYLHSREFYSGRKG